MGMVVGTNVGSLTAQRHLASSRADMETSMERLASGSRINSAMDDAAGLAISHRLEGKITGLNQGIRNANDGISMLQTAEGALEQTSSILNRMKELATQSASGTYSNTDRGSMDLEFAALTQEITRISSTDFNGIDVLNSASTVSFQVGDGATDKVSIVLGAMGANDLGLTGNDTIVDTGASAVTTESGAATKKEGTFTMAADITSGQYLEMEVNGSTFKQLFDTDDATTMTLLANQINNGTSNITATSVTKVLTLTSSVNDDAWSATALVSSTTGGGSADVKTVANANSAMSKINAAIDQVDTYRGKLGATSNQLEHAVGNLMNRVENQSAARSQIQDTDFAVESANLAKAQVLQQAGTAMLAQANQSGQAVMSLLK